jgi:hypothetical protein
MLAVAHPSHNDALFFKGAQRAWKIFALRSRASSETQALQVCS